MDSQTLNAFRNGTYICLELLHPELSSRKALVALVWTLIASTRALVVRTRNTVDCVRVVMPCVIVNHSPFLRVILPKRPVALFP